MYACVDCHTLEAPVLLFEPNVDHVDHADHAAYTDHAWYVDAPGLAAWLRSWVDGTGWYEETNEDLEMIPWTDFRIRTTAARAS